MGFFEGDTYSFWGKVIIITIIIGLIQYFIQRYRKKRK